MDDPVAMVDAPVNGQAPSLTPQQAYANVQLACAAFSGNLQQHQVLQESLQILFALLPKAELKGD